MINYKLPDYDKFIQVYNEGDHWVFKFLNKNFAGITWNKKICYRKKYFLFQSTSTDRSVRHEYIHVKQQEELTFPIFLFLYILNWIWNIVEFIFFPLILIAKAFGVPWYYGKPYRTTMFEREAYANDDKIGYLNYRKKFAFFKYFLHPKEKTE